MLQESEKLIRNLAEMTLSAVRPFDRKSEAFTSRMEDLDCVDAGRDGPLVGGTFFPSFAYALS